MEGLVFIPSKRLFLYCEEGTGDNLLREDLEEGYVDYINYNLYRFEEGEFTEEDGGLVLLKQLCDEKFVSPEAMVKHVLNVHFENPNMKFTKLVV